MKNEQDISFKFPVRTQENVLKREYLRHLLLWINLLLLVTLDYTKFLRAKSDIKKSKIFSPSLRYSKLLPGCVL